MSRTGGAYIKKNKKEKDKYQMLSFICEMKKQSKIAKKAKQNRP